MEFDRIIEGVHDKFRYALKVIYNGKEYLYKEGDDLDEEIAEAIFAEKEIRLRFIDTEIDVIVFHGRNILELDLGDPNIQEGLKKDGLHLEIVDLLKRGLKGDAADTWEDILESKQRRKINLNNLTTLEKRLLRQWREELKVGDVVDIYHNSGEIWIPDAQIREIEKLMAVNTDMYNNYDMENLFIKAGPVGTNAGDMYPVGYKPGDMSKKYLGKAHDTWGDILESKEQFHVVCTRGPYWLPDEDPDADEHFGYDCLLNGNKIIIGEEPADEFRYVHEADKKTYELYYKNKAVVAPLIAKAIKLHELKKGLKGSAPDTWEDILS